MNYQSPIKAKYNSISPINENIQSAELIRPLPHKISADNLMINSATLDNNNSPLNIINRPKSVTYGYDSNKASHGKSKYNKQKFSMSDFKGRLDCFGYPIIKGGKKHKIQFKEELVKTFKVENWKKFNQDISDNANALKCHCNLI